jgi:hypothetical protein
MVFNPTILDLGCPGSAVEVHWLLTYAARVRSPWSAVVVYERVWLVAHSDTWVFSGCSGFLPQKWPPSAKHPCIIQDPIGNKLSSFHGLSWVNMYVFTEYTSDLKPRYFPNVDVLRIQFTNCRAYREVDSNVLSIWRCLLSLLMQSLALYNFPFFFCNFPFLLYKFQFYCIQGIVNFALL